MYGVCALHIMWEDLAEIRSLAVDKRYQKLGIGKDLVKQCLKEAKSLGLVRKSLPLPTIRNFSEKLGVS